VVVTGTRKHGDSIDIHSFHCDLALQVLGPKQRYFVTDDNLSDSKYNRAVRTSGLRHNGAVRTNEGSKVANKEEYNLRDL
jgi:hypothetical protein